MNREVPLNRPTYSTAKQAVAAYRMLMSLKAADGGGGMEVCRNKDWQRISACVLGWRWEGS
jgi:hypothetical protein